MSTLYVTLAVIGGLMNLGSGIGSVARLKVIYTLLDGANVPHSMLVFPIGVLKIAGGLGLLAGLAFPLMGTAAAAGLVLFWTCAIHTHVLANFWPKETSLSFTFLGLAVGTLALDLALHL